MLTAGLTWLGRFDEALETCRAILAPATRQSRRHEAIGVPGPEPARPDDARALPRGDGGWEGPDRRSDRLWLRHRQGAGPDRRPRRGLSHVRPRQRPGSRPSPRDGAGVRRGRPAGHHRLDQGRLHALALPRALPRRALPWRGAPLAGDPSETPVFVVGMPRSGTSLVEQILASHARVFGAGGKEGPVRIDPPHERRSVQHAPRTPGTPRACARRRPITSFISGNWRGAPIGSSTSCPTTSCSLATSACFFRTRGSSSAIAIRATSACRGFTTHFGDGLAWSSDLAECAERAVAVENLMDHWRAVLPGPLLEINYEDLVADLETQSRRLIDFLGLDWDPACLSFHRTERSVSDRELPAGSATALRQFGRTVAEIRNPSGADAAGPGGARRPAGPPRSPRTRPDRRAAGGNPGSGTPPALTRGAAIPTLPNDPRRDAVGDEGR